MQESKPLSASEVESSVPSLAERGWLVLPVIGWIISNALGQTRVERTLRPMRDRVARRSPVQKEIWGADMQRQDLGSHLAHSIESLSDWPSGRLVPGDALCVLWHGESGEGVQALMDALTHLGLPENALDCYFFETNEQAAVLWNMTLGELTDLLVSMRSSLEETKTGEEGT